MTKRQKFVLSSAILLAGFVSIQFLDYQYMFFGVAGLGIMTLLLSAWSLRESLSKNAALLVLIIPVLFTVGAEIFFLGLETGSFPDIWGMPPDFIKRFVQVLVGLVYVIGIYALLLTANIYTVAAARTIQLLRSAHAVGFVLTLVTAFFLFNTAWSLKEPFWMNGLVVGLVSFLLFLQGFWTIELEQGISREVLLLSIASAFVVSEIATVLSFWPVTVSVASLAVTTAVYVTLGLGQAKLQQRLFAKTVKEYLFIGAIVACTMFLTAKWGG